ncbi:MAG: L,D-transpeptidase, partial [Stellaceae bacterium]
RTGTATARLRKIWTQSVCAAWIGAALRCFCSVPLPAAPRPLAAANFQPTMADVPPGVDHGNSGDDLPDQFQRRAVFYRSQLPVGTIIIDTADRHLYLIESETRALRYGIGVGRNGFDRAGLVSITRKVEWPQWQTPADLLAREPSLPRVMAGGPGNPLGARAMELGSTTYRIHGTNAPETIGQVLMWGCFRLVNEDVIDLYDRVSIGTRVIVRQN